MLACRETDGSAVSATTRGGSPLHWVKREIVLRPASETRRIEPKLGLALGQAVASWNAALRSCDAPRLVVGTPLARPAIREDLANEVLFHDREWCPPAVEDLTDCYDATLNGSTRVRPRQEAGTTHDGEIKEADIELNGVGFRWSPRGEEPNTLSLEAALAHELGHLLGLDHPCSDEVVPARRGDLVLCTHASVRRAVMHPRAAELLVGEKVEPLDAEVALVCRNHANQ
jgi:hypothetical protein